MKAHAALFTFSAFFLIAGQAAASRPQAAVRISSFTKFEEAVGAVCPDIVCRVTVDDGYLTSARLDAETIAGHVA